MYKEIMAYLCNVAFQAPLYMGFSMQEYWSGLPFPFPNWILLSHIKEHFWVSSNEVDKPRAYCTEWSKPEREKQMHVLRYMCGI